MKQKNVTQLFVKKAKLNSESHLIKAVSFVWLQLSIDKAFQGVPKWDC